MKIGVAGLGAMGAAVAGRHRSLGNEVTVWNRTPDKAKPLAEAGAKVMKSPAEVAAESDTVPKVRGKCATMVECPVGGSTTPAREGKLLGLMGAEPADAERARPILE